MYSVVGSLLKRSARVGLPFADAEVLRFRRLLSDSDLSVLQKHFSEVEDVTLPLPYLACGEAFVCEDGAGRVLGGFALVKGTALRTLRQIPVPIALQGHQLSELTGLWLAKVSGLSRLRFWLFLMGAVLAHDCEGVIYAVDAKKEWLREKRFNHIRSRLLYEGPVLPLEGNMKESIEAIEIALKRDLCSGFASVLGHMALHQGRTPCSRKAVPA